jgi:hypothetical protein
MDVDYYRKAPFKQSDLLLLAPSLKMDLGTAKAGICEELTWKWLKRISTKRHKYINPKARMDAFVQESTFVKAVERHKSNTFDTAAAYRIGSVRYGFPSNEPNSYEKAFQRLRLSGGGLFISFTCPNYHDGKHSIGIYIAPTPGIRLLNPNVHVFDANEGEYELKYGYLSIWLPTFLQEKYGAIIPRDILECHYMGQ